MRVIALQYAPHWLDKGRSHRTIESLLEAAAPPPGAFVVLPELADTGWCLDDDAVYDGDTLEWAAALARRFDLTLQVGLAIREPDAASGANAVAIVHRDGTLAPIYRKLHTCGFSAEPQCFTAGDRLVTVPVEDTVVAPQICYDLRFPELQRLATVAGAEVLAFSANWPASRHAHWRAMLISRAIENQCVVVAANRTGSDPSLAFDGGSMIVAPSGEVLAEGGSDPASIAADLDLPALRDWRRTFPALTDRRPELLGNLSIVGREPSQD